MKQAVKYLIAELTNLIDYEDKQKSRLGDYITADIANEWEYEHFKYFLSQLNSDIINVKKIDLGIKMLCENFSEVSISGKNFEKTIWTLDGLKNHPFWKQQRILAKELLVELGKANI